MSGSPNPMFIGSMGFSNYHHGKLDDIRVYNRALNECEVLELYEPWQIGQAIFIGKDTVCENESATIGIVYSDTSKTYHLEDTITGNQVGSILAGNTDSLFLSTSALTATTTFRVVETHNATGCQRIIDTSFTVTVKPLPSKPVISLVGTDSLKCSVSGSSYQWFLNGSLLPDFMQTIFAPQYGKYKVIVIANGCQSDTSVEYSYSEIGIDESLIKQDIVICPNPNNGTFKLKVLNINGEPIRLTIIDLLGRTIVEKELSGKQSNEPISVNNIENGIYFTRIKIGKNFILYKTISINPL